MLEDGWVDKEWRKRRDEYVITSLCIIKKVYASMSMLYCTVSSFFAFVLLCICTCRLSVGTRFQPESQQIYYAVWCAILMDELRSCGIRWIVQEIQTEDQVVFNLFHTGQMELLPTCKHTSLYLFDILYMKWRGVAHPISSRSLYLFYSIFHLQFRPSPQRWRWQFK